MILAQMILAQKGRCDGEGLCYASDGVSFWGGMNTTSYKLLLAVHILAVIAAFGPTLVYATLYRIKAVDSAAKINMRLSMPALAVAAFSGLLLVANSDGILNFEDSWISGAFVLVILIFLLQWFAVRPAQARLATALEANESEESDQRAARFNAAISTGLIHLALVGAIVLMIWKPG